MSTRYIVYRKNKQAGKSSTNNLDTSKKHSEPNLQHTFWAQQDEKRIITGN